MARSPVKQKPHHVGSLHWPYRETDMSAARHYLVMGFLVEEALRERVFYKSQSKIKMNMKIKYLSILPIVTVFVLSSTSLAHAQTTGSSYTFTQNLGVGSTGADVIALQQLLINKGFLTSVSTPTSYFGSGTQVALAKFQAANGISPASGYAGPKTRLFLNSLNVTGNIDESSSNEQVLVASTSSENAGTGSNQTSDSGDPPEITINPQVIAGVLCYYDTTLTTQSNGISVPGDYQEEVRGSGVIIDSQGDILTNRHIVVQPNANTTITDNSGNSIPITISYQLNHCEVGQLPADATLPTPEEIQTTNPYIQLPVLGYTAQPAFISPTAGLSSDEIAAADFAVLKITGVSQSGPTFGITSVPSSFPYATFLPVQSYPKLDGLVVTYGFPGDVTAGQGNFFETMTMTGSVGHFTSLNFGDSYYADTPLTLYTDMEIAHGRSGSPLFWRGYVIGIVTFFQNGNRTDSGSVATDAIVKGLERGGYNLSISESPAATGITQSQPSYQAQQPTVSENGYQVCSNAYPYETWDGTYNSNGKYNCVCDSGYVPNSNSTGCVAQQSCPSFSSYNSATNTCQCNSGYALYLGRCVSNETYCIDEDGYGATYNPSTHSCTCSLGYIASGGQCVYGGLYCSETYGVGSEYDYSTGGCQCMIGYAIYDNRCVTINQICQNDVGIGSSYLGYNNPNGTYACSNPY